MYRTGPLTFEKYIFQQRRDLVLDYIITHFDKGTRIFDLGCGAGPLTLELLSKHYACIGMDFSWDMIGFARNRLKQHNIDQHCLVQGDSLTLPFTSNSFDCVACVGMISYVPDPGKVLGEIFQVLRSEGKLIITYRNHFNTIFTDPLRLAKYIFLLPKRILFGEPHSRPGKPGDFLKPRQVNELLAQHGFMVEQTTGIGFGPIRIRGKKILPEKLNVFLEKSIGRLIARINSKLRVYTSDITVSICRKIKG